MVPGVHREPHDVARLLFGALALLVVALCFVSIMGWGETEWPSLRSQQRDDKANLGSHGGNSTTRFSETEVPSLTSQQQDDDANLGNRGGTSTSKFREAEWPSLTSQKQDDEVNLGRRAGTSTTGSSLSLNRHFLQYRPTANLASSLHKHDWKDLANETLLFVGDSWCREMYKSFVVMLSGGLEASSLKYAPAVRHDERANKYFGHATPDLLDDPRCRFETCGPGLALEQCGRPGADSWTSKNDNISLRFQFKTYLSTPQADALLFNDIAQWDPAVILVNVGRWGAAPEHCSVGTEEQQLHDFINGLNATTIRPVLWLQSQVKVPGGFPHDIKIPREDPYKLWTATNDAGNFRFGDPRGSAWDMANGWLTRDRFVRVDLNSILSTEVVEKVYKLHFDSDLSIRHQVNELYVGHGFSGPFMDEVTALLAHFVQASVAAAAHAKSRFETSFPFENLSQFTRDNSNGHWGFI